jgi:hypothetical protein
MPLAGAGVVAAVAGPATAASRAAAAAADRRGEGRTGGLQEADGMRTGDRSHRGSLFRIGGMYRFDHGPLELSVTYPSRCAYLVRVCGGMSRGGFRTAGDGG